MIDLTVNDSEVEMEVREEDDRTIVLESFLTSRFQVDDSAASLSASRSRGADAGGRADSGPPSHPQSSEPPAQPSEQMGQSSSTPLKDSKGNTSFMEDDSPLSDVPLQRSPSTTRTIPRSTPAKGDAALGYHHTSKPNTPRNRDAAMVKIETQLCELTKEIDRNHAKLVHFNLRMATQQVPADRRHLSAVSHLQDLKAPILPADTKQKDTMKIQLKLHRDKEPSRVNAGRKKMAYEVTSIRSNKERVPRYRFHHVEISRNILSPNTSLKFVPHLRDMKDNEEDRYRRWINELEAMDVQSGFNATSSNRAEKAFKMLREEMAVELSFYIDRWIPKLGLESCSKASLVRYMATQPEDNDKMTPQQRNSIVNRLSDDVASPRAVKAAKMFTTAFNNVWEHTDLSLKDVLVHDETVEAVVENKKLVKDGKPETETQGPEQLLETVESNLASYTILGCLFCYSHSCEHGDHDQHNSRRAVGVELIGKFGGLMRQNLATHLSDPNNEPDKTNCLNQCWIDYRQGNQHAEVTAWSEDELQLLRGMFIALGATNLQLPCFVSTLVGRRCWEVYRELLHLELDEHYLRELANVEPPPPQVKGLPWYDRFRKELKADWHEHLNTQEFTRREIRDPCNHSGPCGKGCPCVDAKLLCDRFCRCTADSCAYKYTGCACHAIGKTCLQQKVAGRPCICVQLNRECDPVLCSGCGASERADPLNAYDADLHATGCQNVALQRGVSKTVLLGESQIQDCGYGLFTAEDIAADEFVIEYVGELISHDEGVRREARRGDVFDDSSHSSYLFTLLDFEGIWVDAAIYGNLSRYINHASEADKIGRKRVNIIPQILFVNGDFRIKFKALRDIKAGEELFFNYGENFTNLTKKLLDAHDGESRPKRGGGGGRGSRGGGRGSRGGRGRGGRGGRGRGGVKLGAETKKAPMAKVVEEDEDSMLETPALDDDDDDDDDDEGDDDFNPTRRLRAKRGVIGFGPRGGRKRKREVFETRGSLDADSDSPLPEPRTRGTRGGRSRGRGGLRARRGGGGLRGGGRSRGGVRSAKRIFTGESVTTTAAFALNDDVSSHSEPTLSKESMDHTSKAEREEPKRRVHTDDDKMSDNPGKPAFAALRGSPRTTPHATLGTPSSKGGRKRRRNVDDDDEDSEYKTAIPRSGSINHSPSLRRRRRHIPDSDEDMLDTEDGAFHTPRRRSTREDNEEGMHDGSSSLDRSQRPRQMPARYRDGEE
ncbi:hypothetical protein N0V93_001488 [Gnomoniopsis smithogilvyi]|uniref:Uncharacterized protein n=1 Tax=Gnomoniopsis smithogilvyi TaxID=1191159 RepID=A0A9W9D293_9PEZI|nr:hypothetical protein N0V93_001488 [Gnomoniopsis smithogilvyi]